MTTTYVALLCVFSALVCAALAVPVDHPVQVGAGGGYAFTPAVISVTPFDTITFNFTAPGHNILILAGGTTLVNSSCPDPIASGIDSCTWAADSTGCANFSNAQTNTSGQMWVYNTDNSDAGKTFVFYCQVHCQIGMIGNYTVGAAVPVPPTTTGVTGQPSDAAHVLVDAVASIVALLALAWRLLY